MEFLSKIYLIHKLILMNNMKISYFIKIYIFKFDYLL